MVGPHLQEPVSLRSFERDLLSGDRDTALRFATLISYLKRLGFVESIRGSHHILRIPGLTRPLTLQPDGAHCKPYQVQQVRKVLRERQMRLFP